METESTPPTRGKTSDAQVITLTLRLPATVAQRLRRLARRHDRSLNGELVWALRAYVATVEREEENERSGE